MTSVAVRIITGQAVIMSTSEAKDLVSLLAERSNAWQGLWTLFYTVSAAIITLIASGKLMPKYRVGASIIAAFLFLLFAMSNYMALEELREQRAAVVEFVKEKANDSPPIIAVAEAAVPPSYTQLKLYYWGLWAFVVVLLWAIPAFQKQSTDG
jgi:hypothetical protein